MTSTQDVEKSVNTNSPSMNSFHLDDQISSKYGFKPFSIVKGIKEVHTVREDKILVTFPTQSLYLL